MTEEEFCKEHCYKEAIWQHKFENMPPVIQTVDEWYENCECKTCKVWQKRFPNGR